MIENNGSHGRDTRRRVLAGGVGWPVLAWAGALHAQTKPPVVIGWLSMLGRERNRVGLDAFNEGMAALGPVAGSVAQIPRQGGLFSYGPNAAAFARRPAYFVDRILKGAKPGDLPIEQPTEFDLVLNLKTANQLGIVVPQSMLIRATEVIE